MKKALASVVPAPIWNVIRDAWRAYLPFHRNGWGEELRRRRRTARILNTPPQRTPKFDDQTPAAICMMCYQGDWLQAVWALKSFYRYCKEPIPLFFRLQGEFPAETIATIQRHFPDALYKMQAEADQAVEEKLRSLDCPQILEVRKKVVLMQKLTDFPILCPAPRILILDSDVLFFREPKFLMDALMNSSATFLQRDAIHAYVLNEQEIAEASGVSVQSRLNVGLMACCRSLVDFPRMEQWLKHPLFIPCRGLPHIEQTLWVVMASAASEVRVLPDEYLLSMKPTADLSQVIARHYVNPVRTSFYTEGIPHLIGNGFLER